MVPKCAGCGYEPEYDIKEKKMIENDKAFVKIFTEGDFYILPPDSDGEEDFDVHLYACPRCGTVKMTTKEL